MVTIVDTISSTQLRPRHPEKVNRPDAVSPPKPDWIRLEADCRLDRLSEAGRTGWG